MSFSRTLKHFLYPWWKIHTHFPQRSLDTIEQAIADSEKQHSGQVRFAIESSLPYKATYRDELIEERSLEVFSILQVWDTENNNGVLIYVCLADKQVSITADREINKKVTQDDWNIICEHMKLKFADGDYEQAVTQGIKEITLLLARYFPKQDDNDNELSNKPVLL